MFIDASAMVAIITGEEERGVMLSRLQNASSRYVSPTVVFEAVASVARKSASLRGCTVTAELVDDAREAVANLLDVLNAKEVIVTDDIGRKAIAAFGAYGKPTGHPAQLNFGDCFAYACAKAYRVPLLYKGNDFVHTDLA